MNQLPIFVNVSGHKIVLLGKGKAADAKRRLIERAGATCVTTADADSRLAFIAIENETEALAAAAKLRARGLLVNVVDRLEHCDFTTPSIVDRDPVLIAIGTGGVSAGLAKAVRQRIETLLPQSLGGLANAIGNARAAIKARWPDSAERRRALDAAFAAGGSLDPAHEHEASAVKNWLEQTAEPHIDGLIEINLMSADPDDLTLRTARLLGEADHIFHDIFVPPAILNRARADAVRHTSAPPVPPPAGLTLWLRLPDPEG